MAAAKGLFLLFTQKVEGARGGGKQGSSPGVPGPPFTARAGDTRGGRPLFQVPHFSGVGGNLIRYFHGVIWGVPWVRTRVTEACTWAGAACESHPASEQNPLFMVCGDRLSFTITGLSELMLHYLAV